MYQVGHKGRNREDTPCSLITRNVGTFIDLTDDVTGPIHFPIGAESDSVNFYLSLFRFLCIFCHTQIIGSE